MKLFTSDIQKQWDKRTVEVKNQRSLDLMELAAELCTQEILECEYFGHFLVVCGIGNNGGDGLAIACLLKEAGMVVDVLVVGSAEQGSPEFITNLNRVIVTDIPLQFLSDERPVPFSPETIIVDCLFGVGVNRSVQGIQAHAIQQINASMCEVISIDVPSGMVSDSMAPQSGPIVKASLTLALHGPKRAFMFPENAEFLGRVQIVNLLLDDAFEANQSCDISYYAWPEAIEAYIPRPSHAYKNSLGHGLIIGGSLGKMGAVLLSAEACMRSGSGLCTIHIPSHGLVMAQIKLREAMISLDEHPNNISSLPDPEHYKAIGIGPGLGTAQETANAVRDWLSHCSKHVVLDADALNIIAQHPENRIWPKQAVITPHIGEFDRLFGVHNNNFERIETMRKASIAHEIVIILKGHYTAVASPDGLLSFNSSGFSGLATAGAGDVLTGIITGLLCQGYDAAHAARLGVFLHGEAGHAAGYELSVETMLAGDIITHLSKPFSQLNDLLPM
ncbi:MAG: hypothetical protein RLZZ262_2656 [Bacteroidota bacterium]|jgi:ADP-dependent NAD(P)H-hydrate dehydratase / NAD(P)H-hydrate epimerase